MAESYFGDDVVVVTGGGRGLGRAYCLELARDGAAIVVNDVAADVADDVVREIESAGGRAAASYDSVATLEGARSIVDTALERFGALHGVVNNAGSMANGMFEEITPAMLDRMLDVHVRGSFFVTQAAWPRMREQGYGRVVMVSSSGGMFAASGHANYAAAKAGLYGLCKALSWEGQEHGILVNALLPFAETTIAAADPVPGLVEAFPKGLLEGLSARGRPPEAVAPMVAYLVSRACTVTGEAFCAGMGHFARVFVAHGRGWNAADTVGITVDDIARHVDEIRDLGGHRVPKYLPDELELIAQSLGLEYG
jgi:NAD(P)-dependent dehydrogenase (short-subunit alcohol dehydrogenase family)